MAAAKGAKLSDLPTVGTEWRNKKLNPKLMAIVRELTETTGEDGTVSYSANTTQPLLAALLEDAEFTVESQYSTPFESSNPEGRLPNLMGMIQSGQASAAYYSLFAATSDPTGFTGAVASAVEGAGEITGVSDSVGAIFSEAESALSGLKGRSNFTKLNSRQIYTSSNSIRISGSMMFVAWADAKKEVEDAIDLLQQWASPKKLSTKSLLVGGLTEGISEGLFPSEIPPIVQLQYGGKVYKPLVIESVSAPITAPMNSGGNRIAVRVQVTFLSLTAWDKNDISNTRRP